MNANEPSDGRRILLLSVRPEFARRIFDGLKTTELRRVRPRIGPGDRLVFYVSCPEKAVRGCAIVRSVHSGHPADLWSRFNGSTGLARREFDRYCRGTKTAHAIRFGRVQPLPAPVPLSEVQAVWRGFRPPQVHKYLSLAELQQLWLLAREEALRPQQHGLGGGLIRVPESEPRPISHALWEGDLSARSRVAALRATAQCRRLRRVSS